jgi:hypothetical protein
VNREPASAPAATDHHVVLVYAFVDIAHAERRHALWDMRQVYCDLSQSFAQNPFVRDVTARW